MKSILNIHCFTHLKQTCAAAWVATCLSGAALWSAQAQTSTSPYVTYLDRSCGSQYVAVAPSTASAIPNGLLQTLNQYHFRWSVVGLQKLVQVNLGWPEMDRLLNAPTPIPVVLFPRVAALSPEEKQAEIKADQDLLALCRSMTGTQDGRRDYYKSLSDANRGSKAGVRYAEAAAGNSNAALSWATLALQFRNRLEALGQ